MPHSYLALARQLKADIRRQRLAVGERLPSVRALAQAHGLSVDTVQRCHRHLEHEGYVQTRAKSGTYVADWKALQRVRQAGAEAPAAPVAPPVQFDLLPSLQHRLTQLHALTAQPLRWPLHLADAEPAWYPCEALARAGQRQLRRDPLALGAYATGTGLPALKQALVAHLARSGVDLAPADLLVTSGATESLQLALRALTRPGDAVAVASPVYFGILQMAEQLGLRTLEIPSVAGQGMSLEALDYALTQHGGVRAVVAMPSLHNPLGCGMSDAAKRRLLALVEQHGTTLVEDDAFGDLAPGPERPRPVKAWDRGGRVVHCGSANKALAPALRVGWVAGGRLHRQIEALKLSSTLSPPVFEQAVLAEFMASGGLPAHLRRLRERLAATAAPARVAVAEHFPAGTRVSGPAAGWWLWIELPVPVDTAALLPVAVAHGISFTPGALFSASGRFGHHLRLNIARPWGRPLEQGIRTLAGLVRAASGPG